MVNLEDQYYYLFRRGADDITRAIGAGFEEAFGREQYVGELLDGLFSRAAREKNREKQRGLAAEEKRIGPGFPTEGDGHIDVAFINDGRFQRKIAVEGGLGCGYSLMLTFISEPPAGYLENTTDITETHVFPGADFKEAFGREFNYHPVSAVMIPPESRKLPTLGSLSAEVLMNLGRRGYNIPKISSIEDDRIILDVPAPKGKVLRLTPEIGKLRFLSDMYVAPEDSRDCMKIGIDGAVPRNPLHQQVIMYAILDGAYQASKYAGFGGRAEKSSERGNPF